MYLLAGTQHGIRSVPAADQSDRASASAVAARAVLRPGVEQSDAARTT